MVLRPNPALVTAWVDCGDHHLWDRGRLWRRGGKGAAQGSCRSPRKDLPPARNRGHRCLRKGQPVGKAEKELKEDDRRF